MNFEKCDTKFWHIFEDVICIQIMTLRITRVSVFTDLAIQMKIFLIDLITQMKLLPLKEIWQKC